MADEAYIAKKIEQAIGKDTSYIKYYLDFQNRKGELYLDGEKIETPDYSFGEISDLVKRAYDSRHPVAMSYDVGFRGETLVRGDGYELSILATGGASIIEYTVRKKEAQYE